MFKKAMVKLENGIKEILLKKISFCKQASFRLLMSNLKDQYLFRATREELYWAYPLIKHSLHNLLKSWYDTKNWKQIERHLNGRRLLIKRDKNEWVFDVSSDHWTTLSGILKAAELNVMVFREGKKFAWTDGEVRLFLRDRFLLGPDVSTVHEVFYEKVYSLPIDLDLSDYSVLDIGGYIGDSALWFVKQGAAEIHVYEPIPVNFEILEKNVDLNKELILRQRSRINIYYEGISDFEKEIQVPYWGGPGTSLNESLEGKEVRRVKTTRLEKAFERTTKPIGLVKVDCEGCEFQIFSTHKDKGELLRQAKAYIVEVHGDLNKTKDIKTNLEKMGYSILQVEQLDKRVFVLKAVRK